MGLDLEVGDTSDSLVCPNCNGGRSNERTFYITRTDRGLLYVCFRVSCKARGFIGSRGQVGQIGEKSRVKRRPFRRPTRLLKPDELAYFEEVYGLLADNISDWRWAGNRVLVPYYNLLGYQVGYNWRGYPDLCEFDGPKTISYFDSDEQPLLDWRIRIELFPQAGVILVEDSLSAIKIWQAGYNAIALNGTELSEEAVVLLTNAGVEDVVVWLDQDANHKSADIARQYGLAFRNIKSYQQNPGYPDPKLLPEDEIVSVMEGMFDYIKRKTTQSS